MLNILNLKSLRDTNMKVNRANLLAFFKELRLKDDGNSWKVEELLFFVIGSLISLDVSKCSPSWINKLERGLALQSSCPACLSSLFWSRPKYWKLEPLFPLDPKLPVWKIIVPSLLNKVPQMLNWDYVKCELCFFLVRHSCMYVSGSPHKYTTDTLAASLTLTFVSRGMQQINYVSPSRFIPSFTNITVRGGGRASVRKKAVQCTFVFLLGQCWKKWLMLGLKVGLSSDFFF